MDAQYLEAAKKATHAWRQYFTDLGTGGQPASLASMKLVVDYATFLEGEIERRDARFKQPDIETVIWDHSRPGWWDRFMNIFRQP